MSRPKVRKQVRKDEMIRVLVPGDQKKKITAAANARGLSVSSFTLQAALAEAEKALAQ
jgi:uncharacterized protein (DUF1778 family)